MPEPRDESADPLSLLQKQLILSQVQILELEDVRDELQATIAARAKVLTELQTVADGALRETAAAKDAETIARTALHSAREDAERLRSTLERLQQAADVSARRLREMEADLAATQRAVTEKAGRIETLDAELKGMKASRSWRWMAPLRSLERLFR